MFPSVKVAKQRMKSPLVSRDPRLKKPPTEFELTNELDPIGLATEFAIQIWNPYVSSLAG